MRGKLLFGLSICFIAAYAILVPDPLNDTVSFLIAGNVPGTSITLGLWPSLIVALMSLLLLGKFLSHIRLKMLESKSHLIVRERAENEFKASHDVKTAPRNHSVISAPTSEMHF